MENNNKQKREEKNFLKQYEPSLTEKIMIFFNTYEFGDSLVDGINNAKYLYLDSFAENFIKAQENIDHDTEDFLFEMELEPEVEMQLRKYLLKQKIFS